MKYIITVLLLSTFFSCKESPVFLDLSDEGFAIQELEKIENKPWNSGNFVSINENELNPSSLKEAKEVLYSLRKKGFDIEIAWFNKGASSCGMLAAVSPNEVIIKLKESTFEGISPNALNEFKTLFKPIGKNGAFWCPLKVYEIRPR